ncbi:hypothetical protein DNTS_014638 [Danionella cerebrum]|uniref:RING-type domain-containing protein n=1 Tax=Danionella cerebrum TaxID=2873325 RepID=A0A553R8I7_9TELE|nr:hypothetical protein DNTS_014638 [Danionella translucida]
MSQLLSINPPLSHSRSQSGGALLEMVMVLLMEMSSLLEQSLQCPVCKEVFQEPVLLRCSHTFCRECVLRCWELGAAGVCPECRSPSDALRDPPTCNRAVKNLCEAFLRQVRGAASFFSSSGRMELLMRKQLQEEEERGSPSEAQALCSNHSLPLELFCLEDRRLLCRACEEEAEHHGHRCSPAPDAARDLKFPKVGACFMELMLLWRCSIENVWILGSGRSVAFESLTEQMRNVRGAPGPSPDSQHLRNTAICICRDDDLRSSLKPLQEKLGVLKSEKLTCSLRGKLIQNQAEQTESDLRKEFADLHRFLHEEEELRLTQLREEEEQKMKVLEHHIRLLNRRLVELEEVVKQSEEEIRSSDISFLKLHLQKLHGAAAGPQDQHPGSEELEKSPELQIDVAKHLGNLKSSIWRKMRSIAQSFPVVLDPNTSHPCLRLSGSLSSLRFRPSPPQPLLFPDSFESCPSVLGSEFLGSGTHCWDVEVASNRCWALGVISESAVQTRLDPPSTGLWRLGFVNGKLGQGQSGEFLMPLALQPTLRRIRVHLDWDGGKVSFLDPLTNTHLHSFSQRFGERLRPYFCSACPAQGLRILPSDAADLEP